MVLDLRDPASPRAIFDAAVTNLGTVNASANNAIATNEPKPLVDIVTEEYDLVFDVGPRATFFLMQAAYPTMKARGVPLRRLPWRAVVARHRPEGLHQALRAVPLKRVGRIREDIGAVVAFLVTDDGAFITVRPSWSTAAWACFANRGLDRFTGPWRRDVEGQVWQPRRSDERSSTRRMPPLHGRPQIRGLTCSFARSAQHSSKSILAHARRRFSHLTFAEKATLAT